MLEDVKTEHWRRYKIFYFCRNEEGCLQLSRESPKTKGKLSLKGLVFYFDLENSVKGLKEEKEWMLTPLFEKLH